MYYIDVYICVWKSGTQKKWLLIIIVPIKNYHLGHLGVDSIFRHNQTLTIAMAKNESMNLSFTAL